MQTNQRYQKIFEITAVLMFLIGIPSGGASAQNEAYRAIEAEAERQPVALKIPPQIRKYNLRIGGEDYKPHDEVVTVTPRGRRRNMYVELVDSNQRVVFAGFRRYEPGALQGIASRDFRVGAYLGRGTFVNADAQALHANASLLYSSIHAQWQPSILGLGVSRSFYSSRRSYLDYLFSSYVRGQFDIDANGLALIAEAAPFGGPVFFRRLHIAAHAGVSSVRTRFSLRERDLEVRDTDISNGRFANLELRIPAARVWIDVQHSWHLVPVELKKIEYRRNIRLDTHALGVRYAF